MQNDSKLISRVIPYIAILAGVNQILTYSNVLQYFGFNPSFIRPFVLVLLDPSVFLYIRLFPFETDFNSVVPVHMIFFGVLFIYGGIRYLLTKGQVKKWLQFCFLLLFLATFFPFTTLIFVDSTELSGESHSKWINFFIVVTNIVIPFICLWELTKEYRSETYTDELEFEYPEEANTHTIKQPEEIVKIDEENKTSNLQETDLVEDKSRIVAHTKTYKISSREERLFHLLLDGVLFFLILLPVLSGLAAKFNIRTQFGGLLLLVVMLSMCYFICEFFFRITPAKSFTSSYVITKKGPESSGILTIILARTLFRRIPFNVFSFLGKVGWHDDFSKSKVVERKDTVVSKAPVANLLVYLVIAIFIQGLLLANTSRKQAIEVENFPGDARLEGLESDLKFLGSESIIMLKDSRLSRDSLVAFTVESLSVDSLGGFGHVIKRDYSRDLQAVLKAISQATSKSEFRLNRKDIIDKDSNVFKPVYSSGGDSYNIDAIFNKDTPYFGSSKIRNSNNGFYMEKNKHFDFYVRDYSLKFESNSWGCCGEEWEVAPLEVDISKLSRAVFSTKHTNKWKVNKTEVGLEVKGQKMTYALWVLDEDAVMFRIK